jgi:DNA polymerase-3 subunit alpha
MAKKKQDLIGRFRASFIDAASERNVPRDMAETVFDRIHESAGFGFNKAHSVAYTLLGYWTAFLKAHHPAEFWASLAGTR